MKNLIIIAFIYTISFNIFASKGNLGSTRSFEVSNKKTAVLNATAYGIIATALKKCEGKDVPDKEPMEESGIMLLFGQISNYEELKELQEKAYKYEKTKYGDINDGQKLALTSEQFIDNKRLKKIITDRYNTEKAVLSALTVAKGIALTELHEMKGYLQKCKQGIYHGAYKPIWLEDEQKWVYGHCEKDWGDSNWTGEVLCPDYEKAEAEYKAASGEDKAKYKAARNAAFATCNKCAMATGDMSRMYVGTGAVCSERCRIAAGEMWDCGVAMKIVNTSGIPTINKLENKVGPSSSTSEEIMNAHLSFINMYRICGREKLLKELSLLRPHFQNSTNFSN